MYTQVFFNNQPMQIIGKESFEDLKFIAYQMIQCGYEPIEYKLSGKFGGIVKCWKDIKTGEFVRV
jgi:hypothetical protein